MNANPAVDAPEVSAAFSVSSRAHCKSTGEVSARGRPMCVHGEMVRNGTKDGKQKWSCSETRRKPVGQPRCHSTGRTGVGGRPVCEHGREMLPNGVVDGVQKWACAVARIAYLTATGRRKLKDTTATATSNGNGNDEVHGFGFAEMVPAG
jgi:hypothetical protein